MQDVLRQGIGYRHWLAAGLVLLLGACANPTPPKLQADLQEPGFAVTEGAYRFTDDRKLGAQALGDGRGIAAEYFKTRDLTGMAITRLEPDINFVWNGTSPDPSIPVNGFSARWTGEIEAKFGEEYTFYTVSDDGVRLWVNGQKLVDNWTVHGPTENSGKITLEAGKRYAIKMEYFQNTGLTVAKLRWSSASQPKEIVPNAQLYLSAGSSNPVAPPPAPTPGQGLLAEYFDTNRLSGNRMTRTDPNVNFDWKREAPFPGMVSEFFSVRWTGQLEAKYTETYTFSTLSDDGVRLWVNNVPLVDNWTTHSPTPNTGTLALEAGKRYDLRLEYFDYTGEAVIKLFWASSSQPREPIPQNQLYPASPASAPAAPSGLSLRQEGASVRLSWNRAQDALSYNLERKDGSNAFTPLGTVNFPAHTDSSVTPGTTYIYRVQAVGERGSSAWVESAPLTTSAAGYSDAHLMGRWSEVMDWPIIAIHAALLPDGSVISWGGGPNTFKSKNADPHNSNETDVWDPVTNTHTTVWNTTTEIFCSGHSLLPDGRLVTSGGHWADNQGKPDTNIFDYRTRTWTRVQDMNAGRWYPSNTTLPNGDILTVSGLKEDSTTNEIPQIWNPSTGWRSLTTAQLKISFYPWLHVAPNGKVFVSGPDPKIWALDTSGTGSWQDLGRRDPIYREYGSSVMYRPGKVLVVGGGINPVASAVTVDLEDNGRTYTTGSMSVPRRQHNTTVLPNGQVLVTGGLSGPSAADEARAVLTTEVWDPATGQFTLKASMRENRMYHSTALLLPDGRVLSAGGGRCNSCSVDHKNAEIYSPPYLFKKDGSGELAVRPVITSAPEQVGYGQAFNAQTPDAASILRVSLVRLSAVTHSFNMNQQFNELSFTPSADGLTITAPANPNLAPPGHYMLFILDTDGVPSVAKIIQIL